MVQLDFDALVVGAGFGGIYQCYKLREQGLSVKVIDTASDVGGTWYWNQYPGAMSDTEAYLYRFSWDKEDLVTYPWDDHYVKQPQVLAYLNHVVKRHDLRKYMQFNTTFTSADFDETEGVWRIAVSTGETFTAKYFITALGLLSKTNLPDIKGMDSFQGQKHHTANWPKGFDCTGKRVGVIGNGSTGIQIITDISKRVKSLTSFQRSPQYSVPSGDGPVSAEYRQHINENYEKIYDDVRNSFTAFGIVESTTPTFSVSAEERERILQDVWSQGNGFRFAFGAFNDTTTNLEANEVACEFVRRKIREIVKDPEKARKLQPTELYARRPLCDGGYYEQFNRENVDIVDLKATPISEITPKGIKTSDGTEYELDVIVFATGFDAVEGNYNRTRIHGRGGERLVDHWKEGPTSYLGCSIANFPNMFMIIGPQSPFCNLPPALETHVELVANLIKEAEKTNSLVEATAEAEEQWLALCLDLAKDSLFWKSDSWIFGANIPGKKRALRFFFGGLANYRERVAELIADDYRGFKPMSAKDGPAGSQLQSRL